MSRGPWVLFAFGSALSFSVLVACHDSSGAQPVRTTGVAPTQSADPAANQVPLVSAPQAAPPSVSSSAASDGGSATAATTNDASGGATSTSPALEGPQPVLIDDHGKALPQTDERPTLSSASFQRRVALIAQAIVTGDPEPASVAFFPLLAYQQVKDVAKPERDYKFRLLANFKRDVLEYHHALGPRAAEAKFDGITVPEKDAKWMAPGSEGNRLGYFRVLRSRLRFTLPTGRTRELELTSMISWRGEWYVVHLHGFK